MDPESDSMSLDEGEGEGTVVETTVAQAAKRRRVAAWIDDTMASARPATEAERGLVGRLDIPLTVPRPVNVASVPFVDVEAAFPLMRFDIAPEDQAVLGHETLLVRLPRMPWYGELGLYLAFLQRLETPVDVGVDASVTRADVVRTVRWLAAFGAYHKLVYYRDGYLWSMYQAYVAQGMLGRHPFCHCDLAAGGASVRTDGPLPPEHPHRALTRAVQWNAAGRERDALRRRYLGSDHYCSHPAWPWATEGRAYFLDFLAEALPATDLGGLDLGRLIDWCSQARYSLEACPIPYALLPTPLAHIFAGLEASDTGRRDALHADLEGAPPFRYLARTEQSDLYTMDMTLLFGHWIMLGPCGLE